MKNWKQNSTKGHSKIYLLSRSIYHDPKMQPVVRVASVAIIDMMVLLMTLAEARDNSNQTFLFHLVTCPIEDLELETQALKLNTEAYTLNLTLVS